MIFGERAIIFSLLCQWPKFVGKGSLSCSAFRRLGLLVNQELPRLHKSALPIACVFWFLKRINCALCRTRSSSKNCKICCIRFAGLQETVCIPNPRFSNPETPSLRWASHKCDNGLKSQVCITLHFSLDHCHTLPCLAAVPGVWKELVRQS